MTDGEELSHTEKLARLRLIRTEAVGPVTFRKLIARFGDAGTALEKLPELARRSLRPCPAEQAEAEMEAAEALGARLIALGEPDYPERLAAIDDAPPILAVIGDRARLQEPSVAIVGARNASAGGRKLARELAQALGGAGYVVVSGLARGVDGEAHAGALASGTVAVLAGGVDNIYPPQHEALYARIAEQGAIVSERRIGWSPTARDFPRRNRIISGLSLGVVVVEAAARSGTLITARFALEQGREVFAVPGSPLEPRAKGTNRLIRDGAHLVESVDDILDALSMAASPSLRAPPAPDFCDGPEDEDPPREDLKARISRLLGPTPIHRNEIMRHADASPGAVADALLELTLEGVAAEHEGGRFARALD